MVPGMTERERRAADLQRLEWLADAVLGPPLPGGRPIVPSGSRHSLPLAWRRRGITAALRLGRHLRPIWLGSTRLHPR
jgi:hypothetical protein